MQHLVGDEPSRSSHDAGRLPSVCLRSPFYFPCTVRRTARFAPALRVCARALTAAFVQLLSNKKLEDWMYEGGLPSFRADPIDEHEGALWPTVAAAASRLPAADSRHGDPAG